MSEADDCRYFLTYSGVKLPFNLVTPLTEAEIANRNTYFKGYFDAWGRLIGFDKLVYGEIELAHRYDYGLSGGLRRAVITDIDGDEQAIDFADSGEPA